VIARVEDLWAGYDGTPVLRDLNLEVNEGEIVGLLGANGAGKTTTLRTISGLVKPLRGKVTVLGTEPSVRSPHLLARKGVAHVTESRNLSYELTVSENIQLALRGSRTERKVAMDGALEMFPPLTPLLGRLAGLLSGGEQQMLALARALASRPKLLMLDEMSLGLAPIIVERLLQNVREISDRTGCAVLLVEQHVHLALRIVDRAYVLSRGAVVAEGTATDLGKDREILESSYLGDLALDEDADDAAQV
jgi:branched-chain amino acid transport system ATP-binding protein